MKRRGFTLIELLFVIAIIATLTGIMIPVIGIIRRSGETKRTRATVAGVALAIRMYGVEGISVSIGGGDLRTYPAWDWNLDQLLDARPELDVPAITSPAHPDYPLFRAGYRGFLETVRPELPNSAINSQGQVVDAWHKTLHIAHAARIYGGDSFGIWSTGQDQLDGTADDLTSWGSK